MFLKGFDQWGLGFNDPVLQSVCMLKTAYKFFICFEFAFIICVHLCLLKYRISIAKTGANGKSDEFRDRQKNERSRRGNPYSSHVKAGKHAGTVYNFKRKSRIRKSLTRLPLLLEFIHKYIFLNFVSFYNGLNQCHGSLTHWNPKKYHKALK